MEERDPEMPEFGPPSPPASPEPIVIIPTKHRCKGISKKTGQQCTVPSINGKEFCLGHSIKSIPREIRDGWAKRSKGIPKLSGPVGPKREAKAASYKTREELLEILSRRLDKLEERWGNVSTPEVEDMFCNLARTMATIMRVEVAEGGSEVRGWRIKTG